jgi:hypothetical protein
MNTQTTSESEKPAPIRSTDGLCTFDLTIVVNGIPSDEKLTGDTIIQDACDAAIKQRGYDMAMGWEIRDAGGHIVGERCKLKDYWQQIMHASKAYHRGSQTLLFVSLRPGVGA